MRIDRIAEAIIVQINGYHLHLGFTEYLWPERVLRNALGNLAPRFGGFETPFGRGPAALHWLGFCVRIHEPACSCRFCREPGSKACNWRRQCINHERCSATGECCREPRGIGSAKGDEA